jgi:hypothetical protein
MKENKCNQSHTSILISSNIELVNSSWDFQSLKKNALLSLKTDVFWPLNESSQISLRLNAISNSKISWLSSKKWVLALGQSLLLDDVGWRSLGFSNNFRGFSLAGVSLGASSLRSLCTRFRLQS